MFKATHIPAVNVLFLVITPQGVPDAIVEPTLAPAGSAVQANADFSIVVPADFGPDDVRGMAPYGFDYAACRRMVAAVAQLTWDKAGMPRNV